MQTKLSQQIVYNYIKNFCYSPSYIMQEVGYTDTEPSQMPFQFNEDLYYTVGAYIVKYNRVYRVIAEGKGPWRMTSIANTFSGEVHSGEKYAADNTEGAYDTSRFEPVEVTDPFITYHVIDSRSGSFRMAFDTELNAQNYIRYISSGSYGITVVQEGNKYTAYWDTHSMVFYEPKDTAI